MLMGLNILFWSVFLWPTGVMALKVKAGYVLDLLSQNYRGRPDTEINEAARDIAQGTRVLEEARGSINNNRHEIDKFKEQLNVMYKRMESAKRVEDDFSKVVGGLIEKNNEMMDSMKASHNRTIEKVVNGMQSSSRGRFELLDARVQSQSESKSVVHPDGLEPLDMNFEEVSKRIKDMYGKEVEPMEIFETLKKVLNLKMNSLARNKKLLDTWVHAAGGGGCIAMLSGNAFRDASEVLFGVDKHLQDTEVSLSGGSWIAQFQNFPSYGRLLSHSLWRANWANMSIHHPGNDCSYLWLGKTRAEIGKNMLECIGCANKTFEECNAKTNQSMIDKIFPGLSYCIDMDTSDGPSDFNKVKESMKYFCSANNDLTSSLTHVGGQKMESFGSCNIHNSWMHLVQQIFKPTAVGKVQYFPWTNYTYLITIGRRQNLHGRRGAKALMMARQPMVVRFSDKNNSKIQSDWANSLAFGSNAIVGGLSDLCWVLESGLCVAGPKFASQLGVLAGRLLARFFPGQGLNLMKRYQIQSLLENALQQASQEPGVDCDLVDCYQKQPYPTDGLPSACLTAFWPILPHWDNDTMAGIRMDAGAMDASGTMSAIHHLDSHPEMDREEHNIVSLDTTLTPYTWAKGTKMQETLLMAPTTRTLEAIGMQCDQKALVETPNGVMEDSHDAMIQRTTWQWTAWKLEHSRFYAPQLWTSLDQNGLEMVAASEYWQLKGGWTVRYTYVSLYLNWCDLLVLDLLPVEYAEALLKGGYPTMRESRSRGVVQGVGKKGDHIDMLDMPFAEAYFTKLGGEIRAICIQCQFFYDFDFTTYKTPECHPGGEMYECPGCFLQKFRDYFNSLPNRYNPWSSDYPQYDWKSFD